MPEMPEAWQHAVSHWMDVVLAFSGPSLVLGYGVLVLALPLLLLPTAFPELSRSRDALWSLVLAALAPFLLMNRLPVFSSAGFGELIATVLMARLAAEVGQGRWASLTPDQRRALRRLPRWRRAGTDVVAAVAQAAKEAWGATARAGKAAWDGVSGGLATGARPGPVADDTSDAEPRQPAAAGDNGQGTEGAEGNLKAATPDESGEVTTEQKQRPWTGLVAMVVQAARNTWSGVSGKKGAVSQRHQGQPAQKTARKAWVRPDPSDGSRDGQGQDGETSSPESLSVAPATVTSPGPAADAADNAPDAAPPQPVAGDDPGATPGTDAAPGDVAAEVVESRVQPVEAVVPPSGGSAANDVVPAPEPGEGVSEEPRTPDPAEVAEEPSAPEPEAEAQPVAGDDSAATSPGTDAAPGDVAAEVVESRVQPAEPATPPPPSAGVAPISPSQDAHNSTPVAAVPDDDPGQVATADDGGEDLVAAKVDAAAGTSQAMTDTSEAEAEPAASAGQDPAQPDRDGEDMVVSSFDDVDRKLREAN